MAKSNNIKPMLAAGFEPERTRKHLEEDGYLYAQPKIDGFRYLFDDGVARSRSWKVWKHRAIQAFAQDHADLVHGWDCEGVPGHTYDAEVFRKAMSELRAEDGATQITLFLFDNYDPSWAHYTYNSRRESNIRDLLELPPTTEITDLYVNTWDTPERYFEGWAPLGTLKTYDVKVKLCPTFVVTTLEEVERFYEACLDMGWEGAILRRKGRGYKWNRSTTLEGSLTKIKPEEGFEAEITGVYAREKNNNEAVIDALGYTKRSAHKANKEAVEMIGGFNCRLVKYPDITFDVGVLRLDEGQKTKLWEQRDLLIGKYIECVSHGYSGGYDKPRTPVFIRFRPNDEM